MTGFLVGHVRAPAVAFHSEPSGMEVPGFRFIAGLGLVSITRTELAHILLSTGIGISNGSFVNVSGVGMDYIELD